MTEIEIAERTVATLTDKRERAALRVPEIAEERKAIGFAVHVDEDKVARAKLNKLNADEAAMAGELQSLDAALKEAGARLEAAKAAAAAAADKANALEVGKVIDELAEHGRVVDDCLHDLIEAGANLRSCLNRLHGLGVGSPNHAQLDTLGHLVVLTALNKTIWIDFVMLRSEIDTRVERAA